MWAPSNFCLRSWGCGDGASAPYVALWDSGSLPPVSLPQLPCTFLSLPLCVSEPDFFCAGKLLPINYS